MGRECSCRRFTLDEDDPPDSGFFDYMRLASWLILAGVGVPALLLVLASL
jgi:hypothetical protein